MSPNRFAVAIAASAAVAVSFATVALVAPVRAQDTANEQGKQVFDYWCAPCHAPGPGHPGTQGLQIKYRGTETPAVLEDRTDLTPAVVRTFVRQGVLSMAPFRKTEITDAELDALGAYLSR